MANQGKEKNTKNKSKHNKLLLQKKMKKKKEQEANKKKLKDIINKAKAENNQ